MTAGTIPCFRAYQFNQWNTILNNNDDYLRWDRWQISDSAAFTAGGWVAGSPDYIIGCTCLERGLYLFHVFVDVSPLGGKIGLSIEDDGGTYTGPPTVILDNTNRAGDGTTGSLSWTTVMSFPPIWLEQTSADLAPDIARPRIKLLNLTGVTISTQTSETMLEIHRLQAFDYGLNAGTIQSQA